MSSLSGQTALITGASSGIGRAIALRLAEEGAQLLLVSRQEDKLQEVASAAKELGVAAEVHQCDLSDEEQRRVLADGLLKRDSPVHILVNNAGAHQTLPFINTTPDDWSRLFALNVVAPFTLAQAFGKRLRRERHPGCLVNIASVAASVGVPGASLYCATKGALVSWSRAIAAEWASSTIRVITISPGMTKTPLLDQMASKLPSDALKEVERAHLLGFGEPGAVADLVAAVVGPAGRWMTGTDLVIDGGYSAV